MFKTMAKQSIKYRNQSLVVNPRLRLELIKQVQSGEISKINGFTLIELIVVVLIIGILSSIAIPQFMSSADKAKQKEASLSMSSYLKAAQSYYTEYSSVPVNALGIKEYVSVTQCPSSAGATTCKTATPTQVANSSRTWYLPSGNYKIEMQGSSSVFKAIARPHGGAFASNGFGVRACFNPTTGVAKIWENSGDAQKGQLNLGYPNC